MKKIAILYTEYTPTIDAIKYQLSDCEVFCMTKPQNMSDYDLTILCNYKDSYQDNAILCHHSLLPSFDCDEPEKEAILAGVKVTGITILFNKPQKIISQYPIFISNDTHYEDLKQEINYIEQTLFPLVIRKILNNEPFEVRTLLNKGCGGCNKCSH